MGYHKRKIKKGTYGEISKITEEYEELLDAVEQENKIMILAELSDLMGAINQYLKNHYNNSIHIHDLITMAKATKSAFKDGDRK